LGLRLAFSQRGVSSFSGSYACAGVGKMQARCLLQVLSLRSQCYP